MGIWGTTDIALACMFVLFALLFAIGKERAAILVSGFNALAKEERQKYDRKRLSKDMRNSFLLWAVILFVGAVGQWLVTPVIAMFAFFIWIAVFAKDVHLDVHKAFDKYLYEKSEDKSQR